VAQYDTASLGLINSQGTDVSGTRHREQDGARLIDVGLRFAFLL
jgi:hypothetical protein